MKLSSFKFAFQGIHSAVKSEKNFRIMLICLVVVIVINILLGVSIAEWTITLLCCGGVLSLELMNSALEASINLITRKYHILAKKAKDFAAGAVLMMSIIAFIIGLLVYIPYILNIFTWRQ